MEALRTTSLHLPVSNLLRATRDHAVREIPRSACGYHFTLHRQLSQLGDDWRELFHRSARAQHVFQSFSWLSTWAEHYMSGAREHDLAIVAVRWNERLCLLLPLVTRRQAGLTVLQWMGDPVSQYGDALISRDAVDQGLLREALLFAAQETGADLIDLRKVRDDANVVPALVQLGATVIAEQKAPYIDLAQAKTMNGYLDRFSSSTRKQRRRRRRRLEEIGKVDFERLGPGERAKAESRETIRHKRKTLLASAYLTVLDGRFERFFEEVCEKSCDEIEAVVSVLRCGDQAIAREIGLKCKDGYIAHVGVFDDTFAKYAPGSQQIDETILTCFETGTQTYDLLAPADEYKLALADGSVGVRDYVYALTHRGAAYASIVLKTGRPFVRGLRDKVVQLYQAWR